MPPEGHHRLLKIRRCGGATVIDEYKDYTPRTLMHEIAECKTTDTASLLTAIIVLCKMIEALHANIATNVASWQPGAK